MQVIKNANIFCPDCEFHRGNLAVSNGIITSSAEHDAEIIDAEDLFVIPGLVDIHFHGCKGYDFCDATPEALETIANYEASIGVTTICPATMTLPEDKLMQIMRAARNFPGISGINLEGPFISRSKIGAQNPNYIAKPDVNMLRNLQEASGGLIKIAVVAPEVEGALEFIHEAKGIAKISLAHTSCDYETAQRAFEAGINHVTHLYNAMNPINHRQPGPIIAALENENVEVELICDGIHVHPAIVRNTLKSFGADRVIFISDSMEAAGMPDGIYSLGGQNVIKSGNKATLEDGKTIAGSVTNLADCMRISVQKMNIPLETAVRCSSINPARSIGLDANIKEGNCANLVALDKELNLVWVMKNDKIIYPL